MKKLIIFFILLMIGVNPSFAQTDFDDLKERVASRVAELNLVEKRGMVGTVTDVSGSEITLSDPSGNTRFVDVDELTKFNSEEKGFGISDIEKGDELGITGLYNKESRRILARFVNEITLPDLIVGVIQDLNSDDFKIAVKTEDNKDYTIDVETLTRTFSYENGELVKSGFSKLKQSENVVIFAIEGADGKTITATKLFHFPGIPPNPNVKFVQKAVDTEDSKPSTGSGKKLTPL